MYSRVVELEMLYLALQTIFKSNEKISRKLKIKLFTIENVFEFMENVRKTIFNCIFPNDATIGCKFDVHQCGRAR